MSKHCCGNCKTCPDKTKPAFPNKSPDVSQIATYIFTKDPLHQHDQAFVNEIKKHIIDKVGGYKKFDEKKNKLVPASIRRGGELSAEGQLIIDAIDCSVNRLRSRKIGLFLAQETSADTYGVVFTMLHPEDFKNGFEFDKEKAWTKAHGRIKSGHMEEQIPHKHAEAFAKFSERAQKFFQDKVLDTTYGDRAKAK